VTFSGYDLAFDPRTGFLADWRVAVKVGGEHFDRFENRAFDIREDDPEGDQQPIFFLAPSFILILPKRSLQFCNRPCGAW
jgi:hypothetical protein